MFSDISGRPAASLIRRAQNTSDETSPWEGISFTQPVGSDRLSDELKRAYPGCSNLRQRKHLAAIAFLQHELMQMQSTNSTSRAFESEYPATPEESSLSIDDFDANSRQSSVSISQSSLQKSQAWPGGSPNVTQNLAPTSSITHSSQQIVFSVTDGHTLQPNTRRTMTKEEKLAYRKTRKRGACSTCRKQKGKCTHTGGSLAGSRVSEETIKFQKRHSIDIRTADEFPDRMPKSPHSVHDIEHMTSPQHQHNTTKTSTVATELKSFQQPARIPADSCWDQAIHQDAQSESARYVHNANVNTYGGSTPFHSAAHWQSFPNAAAGSPHFNPLAMDVPEKPLPTSANAHTSPMDMTFSPFMEYIQDPWNVPQEPREENLEPD